MLNILVLALLISAFAIPGVWLLITRAERMQARVDHEFLARISSPGGKSVNYRQDQCHPVEMHDHLDIGEAINHVSITSPYGRDW